MEIVILKTNINSQFAFNYIKNKLNITYKINECTIDLYDKDRVVRIIGNNIKLNDLADKIKSYGFSCEELPD
jgi:hypothetical protein